MRFLAALFCFAFLLGACAGRNVEIKARGEVSAGIGIGNR